MGLGSDNAAAGVWKLSFRLRQEVFRYGVALGAVILAAGARVGLDGLLGPGVPFITFFPAVALAGMLAGGRAGLAATFLSALVADWLFLEPRLGLLPRRADLVSLPLFLAAGILVSAMAALLSRARRSQQQAAEQLSAELEAMKRLQKVGDTFVNEANLQPVLGEVVQAAVAIARADFGNIQILEPDDSTLRIVAQRGFPDWWLNFWNGPTATHGACGTALQQIERVIVEDVEESPIFIGTPSLDIQRKAGVRSVQSIPLLGRSGKPVGMFSVHYKRRHRPDERTLRLLDLLARQAADIIERAQQQAAVREKQLELELVLSHTPFMLTRCSSDLRYRYVSQAYAGMLGKRPSEIAGKPIAEIMGEKGFETIRSHVEAVLRGESVHYEANVEFAGVGPRHLSVTYVPDLDERGQVIGWLASILDLTEQQRAEKALAESQARLTLALEAAGGAAWGWNIVENRLDEWDALYRALYGFSEQDQANFDTWLARIHPEDSEKLEARIRQMLRTPGDDIWDEQFRILHPEKGERWLSGLGRCQRDPGGTPVRMTGVNLDITERRAAQEVLKRSKEELESLVADRTARLQELVAELEHFSYTITHDMRAPLRAMRGFAEMVCGMKPSAEQEEFLRRIIIAAERMDALIAGALSYSKAIRQDLPLAPLDAGRLLRGMLDTYPEFQTFHADINVAADIPLVMANEAGLTQCFSNLLGNAIKFVEHGKRPEVRVWGELRDGSVRLWVEDKGTGISSTMLPRVFDMFAHGASPQAGTGIGLALVRKVVHRMGGKIGVESEPGKGTRFWFDLANGNGSQTVNSTERYRRSSAQI